MEKTRINWVNITLTDYVANIGQLDNDDVAALNKAVRAGTLVKTRGRWTTGEMWGIGPLKTIWKKA